MDKVLTQQEIDAMVKAVRGGPSELMAEPTYTRWDYRQAGRLGQNQVASISLLHEAFARSLTYSLGALLRTGFHVAMMSAEHLSFVDFLGGIPEVTYLASCKLDPFSASALIQLDLEIAFPLMDLLLGGEGTAAAPQRDITEIEEQVLETAMLIVCRELQKAWQALNLEFHFEKRQHSGEVQQLMIPEEKILCLTFEVILKDCRGTMSIAVPTVISSALLRKISVARTRSYTRHDSPDFSRRLRKLLLDCPFRMELALNAKAFSAELADLQPGKVLALDPAANDPADLLVGNRSMFKARLARGGNHRVAQIRERCVLPADSEL